MASPGRPDIRVDSFDDLGLTDPDNLDVAFDSLSEASSGDAVTGKVGGQLPKSVARELDIFRDSFLALRSKTKSPFEQAELKRRSFQDQFWSTLPTENYVALALRDQRDVASRYTDFLGQRVKQLKLVLNDPWPGVYKSVARKAFREIPASVILDLARSNLPIEEGQKHLRAFQAFKVRERVKANYQAPREFQMGDRTLKLEPLSESREGLGSSLRLTPKQQDTVQLASMFGLSSKDTIEKLSTAPSKWFAENVLDTVVMEKITEIAEAPARALDWLAQQATGNKDETTGQILFSFLKDTSPEAYNVLSGTADALKVFTLDALVIFGKANKGIKLARGLENVSDLEHLQRGIRSAPVEKFVKWYGKLPAQAKGAGTMDRMAERYGWRVKPEAWNRLRIEGTDPERIRRVLAEEALGIGPDGFQTVEKLPFFSWHKPLRDVAEAAGKKGVAPFSLLTGPMRMTWGMHFDPNHPNFLKNMRRFGDYAFEDSRVVDDWMTTIAVAPTKAHRTERLEQFAQDGLREFAIRNGASVDEAEEALKLVHERYPHTATRSRQPVFGFQEAPEGLRDINVPFRDVHLERTVKVFSYPDVLAYQEAIGDVMGRSQRGRKVYRAVQEFLEKQVTRPITKWWLAKPSLGARIAGEEAFNLAGHPEIGKWYRRVMREQFLDDIAHLPFPGHPWRKTPDPKGLEIAPDILLANQRRGFLGLLGDNISPEAARELGKVADEIGDIDPHRWHSVGPEQAAFTGGWYHVINHQVLQDPVSAFLVAHWDDPHVATLAQEWLESRAGERYLSQFPLLAGEDEAAKTLRVLRWNFEDIRRNLPEGVLEIAQGALASGVPVTLRELEAFKIAGVHPPMIQAPVALGELSLDALAEIGIAARKTRGGKVVAGAADESGFAKLIEGPTNKVFGWSGAIADHISRKPGAKAAFLFREEQMRKLSASRVKHGYSPMPEEEIIREANRYSHREMYRMDNPTEKSRADFHLRNTLLFSYAQASFIKRWSRMLVHNPGYVSRLRQMVGAGEDMGFIEKDDNGNLVFQIPISNEFYAHLFNRNKNAPEHFARVAFSLGYGSQSSGAGAFLGAPFQAFGSLALPPGMPFSAQVEPGFGPWLTIPLSAITANKPKLDWARNFFLGGYERWDPDAGLLQNIAHSVGASWMRDLGSAFLGHEGDRAYVSAVRDLVAWADFSEKADPFDKKTWKAYGEIARWYALFKGITRFVFPYALTTPVFMEESEEYRKLIDERGYEAGVAEFLDRQEGKGWPIVAGLSKAAGQDPMKTGTQQPPKFLLAPTPFGEEFYRDHPDFFEKYGEVAGLFTYRAADKFNPVAFRRQMQRGQRLGRDMTELWLQLNIEAGTHEYFEIVKPELDRLEAEGVDPKKISRIRAEIIDQINDLFPGTQEFLDGWSARQGHRDRAIEQLYKAIEDPLVAKRKDVTPLRIWLGQYKRGNDAAIRGGYAGLGTQKATRGIRSDLVDLYGRLQSDFGHSVVLEKAYSFLFRSALEEIE